VLKPYYFAYTHRDTKVAYTLDTMRALLGYLGNPQNSLRVVHVAGTSGKSSTAYYVSALLGAGGAKVGLTVSPHVMEMNERVQINLTPLAEADFCSSLGEFIELIQASGIKPSFFELMIAFAYWEFARQQVDYAVVEVGLGGLLDCTNVISREDKVCVITDIGFDHTNILGNTLAEIAYQKAGIIQPHNQVFMHRQLDEVMEVVRATARQQQAQLHEVAMPEKASITTAHMPLFQQRNFYLAEQAVCYVLKHDGRAKLAPDQLQNAAIVHVPGRMDIFHVGEKTLVLDGAHNGQKMAALLESVRAEFPDKPMAALVAHVGGRDNRWQHALNELARYTQDIIVSTFDQESDEMPKTGMPPSEVAAYLEQQGIKAAVESDLAKAYEELLKRPEPVLIITGSLYMLGSVLRLIRE
jgi:dihydrofolate synthase / folylpolyglutamate synthase